MPTVSELQVVVSADTSQAEGKLSAFGASFGGLIGAGAVAAGAAVAAGVGVGIKAAGDLEQAVANISTIKPEIDTSAVFASLNEMQTRIPQSAAQLGESLYSVFSSVEVSQEQALRLTEQFGKGATAAQTDAQTFGTAVMGVMNAYGLSVDDAAHISDVFFNTVNKGVVTGQELASGLGPVTQAAKSAGLSIDDLGAFIAAVTKEGGPAAQNINNLNNFLQKITTQEAQSQLNALGVATKTATGEFRPTADVLTDLKGRLEGLTEAERANALQAIFPDAQARQGATVLLSQLDLVKSATIDNMNATGVAEAAYAKMSATFNSQVKLLTQGLMSILTTIGGAVLPMITPLVTAFSQWLPGAFQATVDALQPLAETYGPMLAELGQQVIDAWRTVRQVFEGNWSPDASINPIVNALGMIATVIRDVVLPAVSAVASFIVDQFSFVVDWFVANWPLIQQTIAVVLAAIQILWETHGKAIMTVVQSTWTIIKTVISTGLQVAFGLIKTAMQILTGDWEGAWETFKGVLSTAWDGITTIIGAVWDAIYAVVDTATGGLLTKIGTWISETATAIENGMSSIQTAISTGWETIKSVVAAILPTIRSAILAVWNLLPEDIRTDLVLIAGHITTQGAAWVTAITTAGTNMVTAITGKLGEMVSAVTAWAGQFLAPITALVGTASAAATSIGTSMLSAIQEKLNGIVSAVQSWGSSVVSAVSGFVGSVGSAAASIGQAIVNGIVNGISAGVGAIRDAAYRAARAALDAAKGALGIESPSKVFRLEVGRMIPSGVIQGVEDMARPLTSTIGDMVPMPRTPAFAGAAGFSGSAFGGGDTYISINLQGATIDNLSTFEDRMVGALERAGRRGRIVKVTR